MKVLINAMNKKMEEKTLEQKANKQLEIIALLEQLPPTILKQERVRELMKNLYEEAFEFLVKKKPYSTTYSQSSECLFNFQGPYSTFSRSLAESFYHQFRVKEIESSIEVVRKAKQLLGLLLCGEAIIENLRREADQAKRSADLNLILADEADRELFNRDEYTWRMLNR